MFPDKHIHTEAAHIGEELLDNPLYEIERKCESIQRGVERGLFDVPAGLKAYGITQPEYEKYLGEHMSEQLVTAVSLSTAMSGYTSYIHVINHMMVSFANTSPTILSHSKSLVSALRALKKLSKEAEATQYHVNE
jgi:hypothetical protein